MATHALGIVDGDGKPLPTAEAPKPVRPSALQLGEKCALAPRLAAQYPETGEAAERGKALHEEIAAGLRRKGPRAPTSREAQWAVDWVLGMPGGVEVDAEVQVALHDPESLDVITEGTADAIITMGGDVKHLHVLDHKSGQPAYVPPVADSLQLAAYAIAAGLQRGARYVSWQYLFLRDQRASEVFGLAEVDWWPWIERIARIARREPQATPGEHCGDCWHRRVCPSYRERTALALTLLPQNTQLALTDDSATALALRLRQVRDACDVAEDLVRAHVQGGGRVEADGKIYQQVTVAGRRSGPSVRDLEAQGLGHLVCAGQPSTRWEWRKI